MIQCSGDGPLHGGAHVGGAFGDDDAGGFQGGDLCRPRCPCRREMIAPAWPMRLPGGAVRPAMKAATGLVTCCRTNAAASSSAVPPISPIIRIASVAGSASNIVSRSTNDVPTIGSPPRPTHVDWPRPRLRQLPDGLVGQRAAAAHHADRALLVDVARHDADLALVGRDHAGAIRPDRARDLLRAHHVVHADHVEHGHAFGDGDHGFDAGVDRFQNRVGGEGRRHEDHRGVGAGLRRRLRSTVSNTGKPSTVSPLLPGVTPPTIFVPYSWQPLVWNWPTLPVMPWQMTRVFLLIRMLMGRMRVRAGGSSLLGCGEAARVNSWIELVMRRAGGGDDFLRGVGQAVRPR